MKKFILSLFLVGYIASYAAGGVVIPSIDKEIVGVNKEQLEEKSLSTEDVDIDNSRMDTNSSERFITGKEASSEKIQVIQRDKSRLSNEVSITAPKEKKKSGGALKWIIGAIGVAALVIAL
ncbi:MAG: hypothetical protein LBT51_10480 [Fusobacteriaceae bacterium]|jgi:hypothetical protein|nr:hypothetical protein [Fusobacteriaceae bacterium]